MRFLCLAYGNEEDWQSLSEEQRQELLAGDEVLRRRGAAVAVVGDPTLVTAWDGSATTRAVPYAETPAPLVGFSIVEAAISTMWSRSWRPRPVPSPVAPSRSAPSSTWAERAQPPL
jgi:hypothetical protein